MNSMTANTNLANNLGQPGDVAAVWVAPDELVPWPDNPRDNDKAVPKVARSIERFGFGSPIVARLENRELIIGHTRLKAAVRLGLAAVPVRFLDIGEEDAHKLAVADNKTGEEAKWRKGIISGLVEEWADNDDLTDLGYDQGEIDKILGLNDAEAVVEEVEVSTAHAEFFLSVHGPLPAQRAVLDVIRDKLQGLGVTVTVTTTEL